MHAMSEDSKRTAMIVDDDMMSRLMLRMMMEQNDYTVIAEAENGAEAVAMFSQLRPSITIMDICMPIKNGVDATRDILSLDKNAKVVMCSSLDKAEAIAAVNYSGAREVIPKPLAMWQLQDVLHRLMPS
jgi:two-component system, chemotaxis family, chemotaxis protein CheY